LTSFGIGTKHNDSWYYYANRRIQTRAINLKYTPQKNYDTGY